MFLQFLIQFMSFIFVTFLPCSIFFFTKYDQCWTIISFDFRFLVFKSISNAWFFSFDNRYVGDDVSAAHIKQMLRSSLHTCRECALHSNEQRTIFDFVQQLGIVMKFRKYQNKNKFEILIFFSSETFFQIRFNFYYKMMVTYLYIFDLKS